MISFLVDILEKAEKLKLNKQKRETKKAKEEENKQRNEKFLNRVENKVKNLNDKIEKKQESLKTKNVSSEISKKKEQKIRVKIIALKILNYILKFIETFIVFLVTTFGVIGFFIILVVLVLMLAIYGFMQIDTVIYSGNPFMSKNDDCIQSTEVLNQGDWSDLNLSSVNGTMTQYQKNIFNMFKILDEFIKGSNGNIPIMKDLPPDIAFKVYRGIPAVESGFNLYGKSDTTHDIMKDAVYVKHDDEPNRGHLGLYQVDKDYGIDTEEYNKYWDNGTYIEDWVKKYPKPSGIEKDHNFVPYAVAMGTMHASLGGYYGHLMPQGSSDANFDEFKAYVEETMAHFGIVAKKEECYQYIRAFLSTSCYRLGHGLAYMDYDLKQGGKGRIDYLCAVFAASSDVDAERSFNNYKVKNTEDSKLNYAAGSGGLHQSIWGSKLCSEGIEDIGAVELGDVGLRLELKGVELTVPLVKYVYDKYKDDEYMQNCWTHMTSVKDGYLSSYNYGLSCLIQGNHIEEDFGTSMPLASGGSVDDCDCYEGSNNSIGIVGQIDILKLKKGETQGNWPSDVKSKIEGYSWKEDFGYSYATENPNNQLSSTGMTFEQWRQSTKWQVPYQCQYKTININTGGSTVESAPYRKYGRISRKNACHVYMASYMMSALTGKFINFWETFAALRATGGVASNGYCTNTGMHVTFEKLNLAFSGMKASGEMIQGTSPSKCSIIYPKGNSVQEKINSVLDAGGIVGVSTIKGNYTKSGHYFVIIERNGDKYKTASASHPNADISWHTLDFIIGKNGGDLRRMSDGSSFYFAYNMTNTPTYGTGGSTGGMSATVIEAITIPSDLKQTGLIGDCTNYERCVAPKTSPDDTYHLNWAQRTDIPQYPLAKAWLEAGKPHDSTKHIATFKGYYIVACSQKFGQSGERINVILEDNRVIKCIIGDSKNASDARGTLWGHRFPEGGDTVSLIEWESMLTTYDDNNNPGNFIGNSIGDWKNKKVKRIDRLGNYFENPDAHTDGEAQETLDSGAGTQTYRVDCIEQIGEGEFLSKPGTPQGSATTLVSDVDKIQNTNVKNHTTILLEHIGKEPKNINTEFYAYKQDKWKQLNGKGFVRYAQGGSSMGISLEDGSSLNIGDDIMYNCACGAYATAAVISTMTGKYVNPAEVIVAINTYKVRHPEANMIMSHIDGGRAAITYTDLAKVIEECGLKADYKDNYAEVVNYDKIDKTLANNGLVIVVVNSSYNNRYTEGAHYVVIREKTNEGYLIYSSTNWYNDSKDNYCNTANTLEELKKLTLNQAQVIYVTK